jgi:hypothetical protein
VALNVALACGLLAQTPVRRIRQKMIDSLTTTPDFVCTESIERAEHIGRVAAITMPALNVEAGVINAREMYAWPAGADDQSRLREILSIFAKGGSGSFALYSRALFLTTDGSYYGFVSETKDGVALARTDFGMPQAASTYSITVAGKPVTLGYTGSIWMDPATLEIKRLALRADDPPAESDIKSVSESIEFGHARFNLNTLDQASGQTVLVPVSMEFDLQEKQGREERLVGHFSDCHRYNVQRGKLYVETTAGVPAEVALSSAAPAMRATLQTDRAAAPEHAQGPWLPAGLDLRTVLTEAIDERTMVQGTRLSFTVTHEAKKKGKIVLPKGALIEGHVTRVIRQVYPAIEAFKGYYLVGIQMDTAMVGTERFHLVANLENLGPEPFPIIDSTSFVPYSNDPNKWGSFDTRRTLFIVPKPEFGESFLGVIGEFLRLPGHFVMYWSTGEPPG